MYRSKNIQETISALADIQQSGVTLEEATKLLHLNKNVSFDDIWLAIIKIRQLSEKEAMQLTKKWLNES